MEIKRYMETSYCGMCEHPLGSYVKLEDIASLLYQCEWCNKYSTKAFCSQLCAQRFNENEDEAERQQQEEEINYIRSQR
jgi:hypothetical protein